MTFLGDEEQCSYCSECDSYTHDFEEYKYSTSQHGALLTLETHCADCDNIKYEAIIVQDI